MKEVYDFLESLMRNNNRQWFAEHKSKYVSAQTKFNSFATKLIEGIAAFDESVRGLTLADCTYRIYRDIRFSSDKSPYKRHMGVFVCPKGKKSCLAGYYFHIEPDEAEYIGGSLLCSGTYNPTPEMLRNIRNAILYSGSDFEKAVSKAPNFSLEMSSMMARVPNGYPKDTPYSKYMRMRNFLISKPLSKEVLFGDTDALLDMALRNFKTTYDFNTFLNKAAESIE